MNESFVGNRLFERSQRLSINNGRERLPVPKYRFAMGESKTAHPSGRACELRNELEVRGHPATPWVDRITFARTPRSRPAIVSGTSHFWFYRSTRCCHVAIETCKAVSFITRVTYAKLSKDACLLFSRKETDTANFRPEIPGRSDRRIGRKVSPCSRSDRQHHQSSVLIMIN